MSRRLYALFALVLTLALVLAACSSPTQAPEPTEAPAAEPTEAPPPEPTEAPMPEPTEAPMAEPLTLGVISGLTGGASAIGVPFVNGVEFAVDQINADGGIDGRTVELIIEDNETRPAAGVDAALKLVDVDNVNVILCSCFSTVFFPIAEAVADKDTVLFSNGSSTPEVRTLPGHIVSPIPLDDVLGVQLAQLAFDLGFTSGAMMTVNDQYGVSYREEVTNAFTALGGEITVDIVVEGGQPDYRPELQRIASADPDMLLVGTYTTDARLQFRQLTELGWKGPWFKLYPTVSQFEQLEEANGRVYGVESTWLQDDDWKAAYTDAVGEEPNYWAALGYDNVFLAANALNAAASTAADDVLAAVNGVAADYHGLTADFVFDDAFIQTNPQLVYYQLDEAGEWTAIQP